MKEQEVKTSIKVVEGDFKKNDHYQSEFAKGTPFEKYKKQIIYVLMGMVFFGCMYLIFKPSENKGELDALGLNSEIPQANNENLQADKQKAYEQELLTKKNEQNKNTLTSLADYWSSDEEKIGQSGNGPLENKANQLPFGSHDESLTSYRNAQQTLGAFYQQDDYQARELKRQVQQLKKEADDRDRTVASPTMNDQLVLMEKSYQMAAKYLPSSTTHPISEKPATEKHEGDSPKEQFIPLSASTKKVVSSIYREPTDSAFVGHVMSNRLLGFSASSSETSGSIGKNTYKAEVSEDQLILSETLVNLRLKESIQVASFSIPEGKVLEAMAKFQGGRLQLKISSIEHKGQIIPVEINIYDKDGQQGLAFPYSPELSTASEIIGNMSQNSGTSITMTQSGGQQVASDLSRSVVQGVSGYFSKKVRTPKVTLKAGHQVYLMSKK